MEFSKENRLLAIDTLASALKVMIQKNNFSSIYLFQFADTISHLCVQPDRFLEVKSKTIEKDLETAKEIIWKNK